MKSFLNMIKYPPINYEKIIVLAVSSEGIAKTRIGRHSWAHIRAMWNMSREGFKNSTTRYLRETIL